MKEIIYQALRDCNRTIGQIKDTKRKEAGSNLLLETFEKMMELTNVSRKEGLLSLEETCNKLEDIGSNIYLKTMIMLVVDGTDPELVEQLCLSRYFSLNLDGYEGVQYLAMMVGSLAIQAGENPRIIEERLKALIPEEVVGAFEKKHSQRKKAKYDFAIEDSLSSIEDLYIGDISAKPSDAYYYQIKIADYAIKSMDDRSIQRVLRDVDNYYLTLAMKGLSGEARRRIFINLSPRVAAFIADDMESMPVVDSKEIGDAIVKIYSDIVNLISTMEIVCRDGEALCLFGKIFDMV